MKIQDLNGSKEIDMSAVRGGADELVVDRGDGSYVTLTKYLTDAATDGGPGGVIIAASKLKWAV